MLQAPTLTLAGEGKEAYLEWNEIPGASHYLLEITRANGDTYTREEYGTSSYGLEAGATYRIRAISNNSNVRSSLYSAKVTFTVKLASPELKSVTADMVNEHIAAIKDDYSKQDHYHMYQALTIYEALSSTEKAKVNKTKLDESKKKYEDFLSLIGNIK